MLEQGDAECIINDDGYGILQCRESCGKTECHSIILDSELRWRSVTPFLEGRVVGLPDRKGGWAV